MTELLYLTHNYPVYPVFYVMPLFYSLGLILLCEAEFHCSVCLFDGLEVKEPALTRQTSTISHCHSQDLSLDQLNFPNSPCHELLYSLPASSGFTREREICRLDSCRIRRRGINPLSLSYPTTHILTVSLDIDKNRLDF